MSDRSRPYEFPHLVDSLPFFSFFTLFPLQLPVLCFFFERADAFLEFGFGVFELLHLGFEGAGFPLVEVERFEHLVEEFFDVFIYAHV